MAANTVNGRAIQFKVANDLSELKSARISQKTSDTLFRCGALSETTDDAYIYGYMRLAGGSTYVQITDYAGTNREFTVDAGLSVAVGDLVEFCWWNPDKYSAVLDAINEAIRFSWDYWFRDVVVEAASSGITLASGDDEYDLPTACDVLLEIGVGANPIAWIPPVEQNGRINYRVEGQAGAFVLRMMERYAREGTLADLYATQNIALHYRTREPEIGATGDTQLPLNYFTVAAWLYAVRALNDASRLDLQTASINLPQLQARSQSEVEKIGLGRSLPSLLATQQQGGNAKRGRKEE